MAPVDELLAIVIVPVEAPAVVGSKVTFTVAVCPGVSVAGTLVLASANPTPLTFTELIERDAVPVELSVTVCVDVVFKVTLPNGTEVVSTASVATEALSDKA